MSGVRRIELEGSGDPEPLSTTLAELAETHAALERAQQEIALLRAQLEASSVPPLSEKREPVVTELPLDEPFDGPASLRRVTVSEAPSSPETQDLRSAERFPCEFEVEFTHDTHFTAGVSSDMSTGGLFVATYHHMPVGSEVTVAFDLPSGHRVEARGEVRWTRPDDAGESRPGFGIAFTELSDTALAQIVEYCRGRPPLCFEL